MSQQQANEIAFRYAVEAGEEALLAIAKQLSREAEEITMYIERYRSVDGSERGHHTNQEKVLSWVVNRLAGAMGNFRLDMLVSHAATIAESRAKMKAGQIFRI